MVGKAEEKLQEQTALTAFQLVWGGLKNLGSLVIDENAVQRGMQEYAHKFLERYGNVKVLNMDQPVPLNEVYVAAQVISPRAIRSFNSISELHETFLQRGQRRLWRLSEGEEKRRDCLELANKSQLLNVLGAPGAGKSTFLRRLGLEALRPRRAWNDSLLRSLGLKAGLRDEERSRYEHDCLPVLIELRRFKTENVDLAQLIQNELANCGLPESEKLVNALLDGGRLLVLLDGIDEVPGEQLDKAITHIRDFIDRYSSNRFVTSCRTAFYKDYFSRFRDVLLADFDDTQIASFVRNWFRSEHDRQRGTADEFLKLLDDPSNSAAKELASTPLLLTFLCLTYDDRQRLPPNRSELYRQALEILMERWAASKRVHNEPVYRELHSRLEVQMLAEIAATAFRDNYYFFTRRELIHKITGFLRDELNAPKHLDGNQVLNAIEIQQGLIVQRAQDAWSFSHLTLQEYLTAVWYETNGKTDEITSKYTFDVRWREVFILLAGAVSKTDDLLLAMQRNIDRRLATIPQAISLLHWANNKVVPVDVDNDAQATAARRAFAIALALTVCLNYVRVHFNFDEYTRSRSRAPLLARALTRNLGLGRDPKVAGAIRGLHDLPRVLERDLDHVFDPNRILSIISIGEQDLSVFEWYTDTIIDLGLVVAPAWGADAAWAKISHQIQAIRDGLHSTAPAEALIQAWQETMGVLVDALQLPFRPDDLNRVGVELEPLLYAYQLMIDCKDASTRVGRSTWERLCQRMLCPVKNQSQDKSPKRERPKRRSQ